MIINFFFFGWSKSSDIFNANGGSAQPGDVDRRRHNGNTVYNVPVSVKYAKALLKPRLHFLPPPNRQNLELPCCTMRRATIPTTSA